MPKYVIEREIAGAGKLPKQELPYRATVNQLSVYQPSYLVGLPFNSELMQ